MWCALVKCRSATSGSAGAADQSDVDWTTGSASGYVPIGDPAGLIINATGGGNTINLGPSAPITLHLNGAFAINGPGDSSPLAWATLDLSQGSTAYVGIQGERSIR